MALASYAWGYDGGTYNGKDMRQLVEAMFPTPASGVVTGLTVTQESSPTSTVSVAAGKAIVDATGSGLTGAYHAWNDAALSSPTIDPTTTNGRKDRLILRVSSGVPALEVVKGTAAASPAEPSITGDNYLELALITLPSSTSNITNAMITDRRVWASALRAPVICTSATRPASPIEGEQAYETDTDKTIIYNGSAWVARGNVAVATSSARPTAFDGMVIYETDTDALVAYDGSGWREFARTAAWQTFTPQVNQNGNRTSSTAVGRYMVLGKTCFLHIRNVVSAAGSAGSDIVINNIPAAIAPLKTGQPNGAGDTSAVGSGYVLDSGSAYYPAHAYFSNSTTISFYNVAATTGLNIGFNPSFALASGDAIGVDMTYEIA